MAVVRLSGRILAVMIGQMCVACLLGLMYTSAAYAKTCSAQDAEQADAIVDRLDSWTMVAYAFKKYSHCDEGSIAEGNSVAIARLLVDHWDTLPQLAGLIKREPRLKKYVLRHIDSTLNTGDLRAIEDLSSSSCSKPFALLCKDLKIAAARVQDKVE